MGNFKSSPKGKTQNALRKELAVQAVGEGEGWSFEITALTQCNLEHK